MHTFLLWAIPIGIPTIIILVWRGFFRHYMKDVTKLYNKNYLKLNDINVDHGSNKEKLMKLYFNRQQAYEFSGHVILIIAILFLISGICLFLYSVQLVVWSEIKTTDPNFAIALISLRTGIAIIVFFICQVLLKLYRYFLKFSLFYLGLFDALFIHEELNIKIDEAVDIFTLNADFGESPTTPIKDAIDLVVGVNKAKGGTS